MFLTLDIDQAKTNIFTMSKFNKNDIQASAKRLSELSSFSKYGYIDLPHVLIDYDDFKKSYDTLIKPQWNEVVNILDDGKGYKSLLTMIERLCDKQKKNEERLKKEDQMRNRFRMVHQLFWDEAKAYGTDKGIGASLGLKEPKSNKPDWWSWTVMEVGSSREEGPKEIKYKYFLRVSDTFRSTYQADKVPDFVSPIASEDTWGDVIDKTAERGKLYLRQAEKYRGLVEIIKFRIKVIEAVLYEYEILGYVGEYEPTKEELVEKLELLDEDLLTFIQVGVTLFEKNQESYPSRDSLISAVLVELVWEETESRRMRERLEQAGLYNKLSTRGAPKRAEYLPLLVEMIGLWKDFLHKGGKDCKG